MSSKGDTPLKYEDDSGGEASTVLTNVVSALTSCRVSTQDYAAIKQHIEDWHQQNPNARGTQLRADRELTDPFVSTLFQEFHGRLEGDPKLIRDCLAKIVKTELWRLHGGEKSSGTKRKASEISVTPHAPDERFPLEIRSIRSQKDIVYPVRELCDRCFGVSASLLHVSLDILTSYLKDDLQMQPNECLFDRERPITSDRHLRGVLALAKARGYASAVLLIKGVGATHRKYQPQQLSNE